MGETADTTTPVQTPAVNFTLINDSVSNFLMLLEIFHMYTCTLLFRLRLILESYFS